NATTSIVIRCCGNLIGSLLNSVLHKTWMIRLVHGGRRRDFFAACPRIRSWNSFSDRDPCQAAVFSEDHSNDDGVAHPGFRGGDSRTGLSPAVQRKATCVRSPLDSHPTRENGIRPVS